MRKVIVAPLNWGLGHASRCIPVIKALQKGQLTPVIASDGAALELLQKEFPKLESIELPSYKISYGKYLKWSLFKKIPVIIKTIRREQRVIHQYLEKNSTVVGIISDNRFGIRSSGLPSVYITHQINVKSGILKPITSYFHQRIIKKFDECWIPDDKDSRFSGELSLSKKLFNQKYIGVLSRLQKKDVKKTLDLLIVLSGPEPNRTQLEEKLIEKFYNSNLKICLVQGKIEPRETTVELGNIQIINFALTEKLGFLLNASKQVICRSGYSSVMDLITSGKSAILIPTKNQNEQEYLAQYLNKKGYFSMISEDCIATQKFEVFDGLKGEIEKKEFDKNLFRLFHGK